MTSFCASIWQIALHKYSTLIYSGFPIIFWVRPRWSLSEMGDQSDKVVMVTGGNSGTGYATCRAMYNAGATVYLACRSIERGQQAIEDIKKGGEDGVLGMNFPEGKVSSKGKGRLELLLLDLADLASVEAAVEDFLSRESKLDILFENAGVMACPEGLYTKQGYTLQFGTNVRPSSDNLSLADLSPQCLGHQHLLTLLLPTLLETSKAHPTCPSRVIITSSAGHVSAPRNGIDFDSVRKSTNENGRLEKNRYIEYGQSKWGNLACVKWLNWEYGPRSSLDDKKDKGELISIGVHPGMIATQLARHLPFVPFVLAYLQWMIVGLFCLNPAVATEIPSPQPLITRSPADGALNQLWAATCPLAQARTISGEYIVPFQRIGRARPDLNDRALVTRVWDWLSEQGGKKNI
ncbi:hypothetical protein P7C73_g6541, partial [Tremellales sp. Uapishka_1]